MRQPPISRSGLLPDLECELHMNRTKQISIPQLVELASLDAFGLLDAEDSLTFEDALLAAPARIRDSIRELQAELVAEDPLLSSEETPLPSFNNHE